MFKSAQNELSHQLPSVRPYKRCSQEDFRLGASAHTGASSSYQNNNTSHSPLWPELKNFLFSSQPVRGRFLDQGSESLHSTPPSTPICTKWRLNPFRTRNHSNWELIPSGHSMRETQPHSFSYWIPALALCWGCGPWGHDPTHVSSKTPPPVISSTSYSLNAQLHPNTTNNRYVNCMIYKKGLNLNCKLLWTPSTLVYIVRSDYCSYSDTNDKINDMHHYPSAISSSCGQQWVKD